MTSPVLKSSAWKSAQKKEADKLKTVSGEIGAVAAALDDFEELQPPLYEQMTSALEDAQKAAAKLAAKLAKDKTTKELEFTRHVKAVAAAAKAEIAKLKKEEKAYEAEAAKKGAKEVTVLFRGEDFQGSVLRNYQVFLRISSEPKEVILSHKLTGGAAKYKGIMVSPEGNVYVTAVSTGAAKLAPEGNAGYKLNGKSLDITAVQDHRTVKVKAISMAEMMKKIGVEGEAGVDFKVFKIGGKVATEKETKNAEGTEVEWEVLLPTDKLAITVA